MEKYQLIEKVQRPNVKVRWINIGGPAVMNDALLSGSADFITAGPPAFITLWDRTAASAKVKGVAAMSSMPMYLNTRADHLKKLDDVTEKDKIAVTSIKVSIPSIIMQMYAKQKYGQPHALRQLHRHDDASRCRDRIARGIGRRRRALHLAALSAAREERPAHPHDHALRRRHGRLDHIHHGLDHQRNSANRIRKVYAAVLKAMRGSQPDDRGGQEIRRRAAARLNRRQRILRAGDRRGPERSARQVHHHARKRHEVRRLHARHRVRSRTGPRHGRTCSFPRFTERPEVDDARTASSSKASRFAIPRPRDTSGHRHVARQLQCSAVGSLRDPRTIRLRQIDAPESRRRIHQSR